jgi:hypothetical protein
MLLHVDMDLYFFLFTIFEGFIVALLADSVMLRDTLTITKW